MKHIGIILFAAMFICFLSCEKEEINPGNTEADHTLFMYMPWSTDLTSYFETNIADMEKALAKNNLKNERVVVFFQTSTTEATLFELNYVKGKSERKHLKSYTNPAITTATGITSFLKDVIHYAPAKKYSMLISCHGMGWIPVAHSTYATAQKMHFDYEGVLKTRYFGGRTSEFQTDITTLSQAIKNAGLQMEYIFFDDCYMSTIEVAYELKDVTGHLIGCPTEIMAFGMPYEIIGESMLGNVDYEAICKGFLSFYQNYTAMPCGTIGVTNCSEVEALAAIMKKINEKYTFDTSLLRSIQRLDGYSPICFFDLGDYVDTLCDDEELLQEFQTQLERVIPFKYRLHTDYYYSMSGGMIKINTYTGIAISDPSTNLMTAAKTETAWYKATH